MQQPEPLPIFVRRLNQLHVAYMVTGSAACIAYGVPRLTHDIDVVIEMERRQIGFLAMAFPAEEFYCPPPEVIGIELARVRRGHFNIIHLASGLKADCYTMGEDPLHRWGMLNRREIEVSGETVFLAPPEYVILRKLEYFQESSSEKHIRDIRGILDVSGQTIDRVELRRRIEEGGLEDAWSHVEKPGL